MKHLSLTNDSMFSPWRNLWELQNNFDRIFDLAFTGGSLANEISGNRFYHPACDVEETDSHFVVSLDLPGVLKKDINIEVQENELRIRGERKMDRKFKGGSERYFGKFEKVISLPSGIEVEKIEATYQDGVLTIGLPKAESAKPKQIKITDSKSSFLGKLLNKSHESKENAPETVAN